MELVRLVTTRTLHAAVTDDGEGARDGEGAQAWGWGLGTGRGSGQGRGSGTGEGVGGVWGGRRSGNGVGGGGGAWCRGGGVGDRAAKAPGSSVPRPPTWLESGAVLSQNSSLSLS